ncbi:uncharacterized protein [Tursiops truncatus]|uniref:uncharacterized protein n=1 Tax=Tursiops truncatus TaxID=9739 RepID=UPI003CCFC58E
MSLLCSTPGGKRVHRGQELDLHGVERPGRQAGEAGGKPGACPPGRGPLRPPHIPGHLQGFPYHPADAGASLHKVCPQDSPCDAFLASSGYGCILPYSDEDGGPLHQLKMAVSSMLGTWLHHYPEHFHQPPEFPRLKMLLAYTELSMPGSDLEQQARLLLAQLEYLEPPEAEGDGEGDSGWHLTARLPAAAPRLPNSQGPDPSGPDPSSPEGREPPSLLGSGDAATGRRVRTGPRRRPFSGGRLGRLQPSLLGAPRASSRRGCPHAPGGGLTSGSADAGLGPVAAGSRGLDGEAAQRSPKTGPRGGRLGHGGSGGVQGPLRSGCARVMGARAARGSWTPGRQERCSYGGLCALS